jgi:hypothetical protein
MGRESTISNTSKIPAASDGAFKTKTRAPTLGRIDEVYQVRTPTGANADRAAADGNGHADGAWRERGFAIDNSSVALYTPCMVEYP